MLTSSSTSLIISGNRQTARWISTIQLRRVASPPAVSSRVGSGAFLELCRSFCPIPSLARLFRHACPIPHKLQRRSTQGSMWRRDENCPTGQRPYRAASQYLRWQSCYRQIVAQENAAGMCYAHVLRIRTDAEFNIPFPPFADLANSDLLRRDTVYKPPHTGAFAIMVSDVWALLPRPVAATYLYDCPEYLLDCIPIDLLRQAGCTENSLFSQEKQYLRVIPECILTFCLRKHKVPSAPFAPMPPQFWGICNQQTWVQQHWGEIR